MNAEQAGQVLAKCASYDRRKTGDADTIAWYQAIGDLAYDDCIAAVIAHYSETTDWIMPAHIRQRVKQAREARILAADIPAPPPEVAADRAAYRAALHAARVAAADGRDPEAAARLAVIQTRREIEAPRD